nr:Lrp/AsnC ligand binding domain-containing protein [Candidatus Njordarchaeota archaeon]
MSSKSKSEPSRIVAYILVKVEAGKENNVTSRLKSKMIREAALIYGAYDMILKVEAPLPENLDEFIFRELRSIDGVKETATCMIASKII